MSRELEWLEVLSNDVKKEVGDNDFVNDEWEEDFNNIKQALIDKDNNIKQLQSKLDKIEEWARNTHMDDISRKRLFKIIKEMENPND